MALKLRLALLACVVVFAIVGTGCAEAGPNDKHVSGKDYNAIVNSTVPKDEQNQVNTTRDSGHANGGKTQR